MKRLLLLLFLLFASFLHSQSKKDSLQEAVHKSFIGKGIPYYKNFTTADYNSDEQNWAACQSAEGIMYFANNAGVLEYDGTSWRKIEISNNAAVFGLDIDDLGTVYVGGQNEFGYLKAANSGALNYVSLKSKLNDSELQFGSVRKVHATSKGIYFVTDNYIFLWDASGVMVTIRYSDGLNSNMSFTVNDLPYIWSYLSGLERMEGAKRTTIISPKVLGKIAISDVTQFKGELLLTSFNHGLFLWKDERLIPFAAEYLNLFTEGIIYSTLILSSGEIALGTYRKGIIIVGTDGIINTILDNRTVLPENSVYSLYQDRQNGLWTTSSKGITRLENPSRFTRYNNEVGLMGSINDCKYVDGKLYAMSSLGGFVLDPKTTQNTGIPFFEKIVGINTFASQLLPSKFGLLACAGRGTFLIKNGKAVKISSRACTSLVASGFDFKRIWATNNNGIFSLYYDNGNWVTEGYLRSYQHIPQLITPLSNGDFWVSTRDSGVDWVLFPKSPDNTILRDSPIIKNYDTLSGLPKMHDNKAFKLGGDIAFATRNGLYRYDQTRDTCIPNKLLGSKYTNRNRRISWARLDNQETISMYSQFRGTAELILGKLSDQNVFEYLATPFNRFASSGVIYGTSPGPDQNSFFYGEDGIIQYNGRLKEKIELDIPALVRKVTLNDSVLNWSFGGKPSLLPFGKNSMIFECSIANFDAVSANKYQYQLEGYDTSWSDWTSGTKKEYTNLPEGVYRFRVRAKNIYNLISKEGCYHFKILPPWYRSWGAYFVYLLLFGGFLWLILQWRSRQLKAENEALEKQIAIRTSEVQHQANQLKIQAEKLLEQDKAKSRFFANISHEFRTPLTLIKGPIEQLEQNFTENLNRETIKMMRRNANRLLSMVNQLLELSKIDEGNLKLVPTESDVYKCLRAAAFSFNSHAERRNMDYKINIPNSMLWASYDRDKLENIIFNLLGNAFKFSEDGSVISIQVDFGTNGLLIQVSDSGKGIPEEKLPYIFDRFYQADTGNTRKKLGSGIGLSLAKDLVDLMGGTITVSSEMGKGTLFIVQLPIQEIKIRQKQAPEDVPQLGKRLVKTPFVLSNTDKRNLPTILLVEDNRDMRHFITEQLVEFYKVKEAVNGEAGLEQAMANPPDLIITDLMMPKMDGIELCQKLKTDVHTSHIPVIMLTAKAGTENKIEGLETGADDYLTKPFDGKELRVRVTNLIEQRKRLRELYSDRKIQIEPKKITVTSIDQKFLEQVLALLEDSFSDPDFGVQQMQGALAMSKTQLHRKLKALTTETPGELLRNFRLKKAAQLLSQKADSVTQIAYKVGFNNLSYFAKCFKELFGVAPSSF